MIIQVVGWWDDSPTHEFRKRTAGELAPTTSALSGPIACSAGALRYVWAAATACVFCCKVVCSARKHSDHLGPIKTSHCDAGLVEYPKTHGQVSSPAILNTKGLDDCLCPRCAGLWKARHAGTPIRRPACRKVDFAQHHGPEQTHQADRFLHDRLEGYPYSLRSAFY